MDEQKYTIEMRDGRPYFRMEQGDIYVDSQLLHDYHIDYLGPQVFVLQPGRGKTHKKGGIGKNQSYLADDLHRALRHRVACELERLGWVWVGFEGRYGYSLYELRREV